MIDRRALNRTVLHRQMLVERTARPVVDVIRHLVAVQAQEPNWPYVGLWSRVAGFAHDDLTTLLAAREVVRGSLIRATQHVLAADDYVWLRPAAQPALDAGLRSRYFTDQAGGLDLDELVETGRRLLAEGPLTRAELGRRLSARYPDREGIVLAMALQVRLAVVHPPPNGAWGPWGNRPSTPMALAEPEIGRALDAAVDPRRLVRRYLAAFGPATVMDVQAWSGLTRLREVVEGMGLPTARDAEGRLLYDLPDAEVVDGDRPVPVRFLPGYDNLLIGYADRSRIVADADRPRVITGSLVRPTFLVDGFVRGTWAVGRDGSVSVEPFHPLTPEEQVAVEEELGALKAFVAGPA
jgi:hypothetical protein